MLEKMACLSIAAWLSPLAAREVLRAHRVAHSDAFLVRRRYLRDEVIFALRGEDTVRAFEGEIR